MTKTRARRPRYWSMPLWARDQDDAHRRDTADEHIKSLEAWFRTMILLCVVLLLVGMVAGDDDGGAGYIALAWVVIGFQVILVIERACWIRWRRRGWPWAP